MIRSTPTVNWTVFGPFSLKSVAHSLSIIYVRTGRFSGDTERVLPGVKEKITKTLIDLSGSNVFHKVQPFI